VGKTSIINKFIFDIFEETGNPTVGIDFISKSFIFEDKLFRLLN
jgi:GTPase SAR1 family protein